MQHNNAPTTLQRLNETYRRFCEVARHFDDPTYDAQLKETYSDFRQSMKLFRDAGMIVVYDDNEWKAKERK